MAVEGLSEELFTAIYEAIGEASMCWANPGGAGEFDSNHAADVGLRLSQTVGATIARLEAERDEARRERDIEVAARATWNRATERGAEAVKQLDLMGASAARMRLALEDAAEWLEDGSAALDIIDDALGADPAPLEWLEARIEEAVEPYRRVLLRMFAFHPAMDARHVVRGTEEGGKCGSCGFPWPCPYVEARALTAGRAGTEGGS